MSKGFVLNLEKWIEIAEKCFESLQSKSVENLYPPEDVQLRTLQKLQRRKPKNLIEHSHYQYLAQVSLISKPRRLSMNLACLFLLIPFFSVSFIVYLVKKISGWRFQKQNQNRPTAVFYEATKEVLTKTINHQYDVYIRTNKRCLSPSDLWFLLKVFLQHPVSYFFLLKVAYKIGHYRYNFEKFRPKAMICCSEYSFTSSAATQWCENQSLIHYNIRHGEKLFHIMDAFSRFHVYTVWSNFYMDLAKSLDSNGDEMFVEFPEAYSDLEKLKSEQRPASKICVFLQSTNLQSWRLLAKKFYPAREFVKIRPHPRWMKLSEIRSIFAGFEIENPMEVQIVESIRTSSAVCSMYSTVLFQGSLAGREIIIDDITNPEFFNTVKHLKLGAVMRPHILLSELTDERLNNLSS